MYSQEIRKNNLKKVFHLLRLYFFPVLMCCMIYFSGEILLHGEADFPEVHVWLIPDRLEVMEHLPLSPKSVLK